MHIPEGFLSNGTCAVFTVVSASAVGYAAYRTAKTNDKQTALKISAVSAAVFGLQMLNFTVNHGTSGHFMGGVLAGLLLGPWAGLLSMAAVLFVQAFVFQDGGILSLGANIFNMGIIGAVGGYYLYKWLLGFVKNEAVSLFMASLISIVAAASACSVMLALSGTAPLSKSLYNMASVHSVIGLGEGVITMLAFFVLKATGLKTAQERA